MSMRIAIAGISHETNTYCKAPTTAADFYQLRGSRLLETSGQESDVGGAVDACLAEGVEPVPLLFASAQPSGTIDPDAYLSFREEIITGLRREQPDALMLCLHGAGVAEGIEDLEGDLVAAIRREVGNRLPITASFDLHGNITQRMADGLNGVFACHHYPHIDLHARAAEAVRLAIRIFRYDLRTSVRVIRLPMLLPTSTTYLDPGRSMLEHMLAAEKAAGVIDVSWFHGFPYTDVAHVGCSVAVTTEADAEQAQRIAGELAEYLWAQREQFRPQSLSAAEAVAAAQVLAGKRRTGRRDGEPGSRVGPVVIHETSDNCGGGAPGDGTHLLRAMLEAGLSGACFGFIVDPEVAAIAHRAGTGATVQIELGGKYDDLHGAPLTLNAYVKALHDGRIRLQAMFKGSPLNLGPLARLQAQGMDIIVASRRSQTFDREPFLAVGIDVEQQQYVALKSSNHFRAGFQELASAIVTADPPGLTTHHIEVFPRLRTQEPLWPTDPDTRFAPH
ncbi:MAG: M81 family metallopeptidase [Pseudomonadales bacterium]|nr:M81 family metallopeptidase [Pseudomonadales bacterium]